MLILEAWLTNS